MTLAARLKTPLLAILALLVFALPAYPAALTKDRITEQKLVNFKAYPIAASTKIYAGSLACLNTSGYAGPCADTVGFIVVGIADAQADNSSGAAGDLWVKAVAPIVARLNATSITQAMLGRKVYVVDDNTIDEEFQNLTNSVLAGVLVEFISATEGWVLIDPALMALNAPDEIVQSFSGAGAGAAGSREMLARDLTVAAAAGSATSTDPAMLGSGRFKISGASLTKASNYIAGVMGRYGVTGTKTTTYPTGGVLGMIEDGVTAADGAVVAVLDGDTATTKAGAAFKVKNNNSIAASGFDFGVDLQDAAHDGFKAVDKDFYKKAVVRLVEDVVLHVMSGAPVDGASGTLAGTAGPGSIALSTNGNIYSNTGTKASPTWTTR